MITNPLPRDGATPADRGSLEERLAATWQQVDRFLAGLASHAPPSLYASADLRDAGWKTVAVDTNAFPAGFNNLCGPDRKRAAQTLAAYLAVRHDAPRRVLLLAEPYTRNAAYRENLEALAGILGAAGAEAVVGTADPEVATGNGATPHEPPGDRFHLVARQDDRIVVDGESVDIVVSNHDFMMGIPTILAGTRTPIVPDPHLGWWRRRKHQHHSIYNRIATRIARLAAIDPLALTVATEPYGPVDFRGRQGLEGLARAVEAMLLRITREHGRVGIDDEPWVFIKDDAGTNGRAVLPVRSGDEVRALSSRTRHQMDKGKQGHKVEQVILQEGVATRERVDGQAAEPVVYLVGDAIVGACARTHPERGAMENLNTPGMQFLPLCVHEECADAGPQRIARRLSLREQVAARISAAALAQEARLAATGPATRVGQRTIPDAVATTG